MMDGYDLCLRFASVPNQLRYCGPEEALAPFQEHLDDRSRSREELSELLSRFEGLYPYLEVIAERNGLEFTDTKVVEAYWIGNELLDVMTRSDYERILERLAERGLPASMASDLARDLPEGLVPHHNAHVCYVGAGRTARTVSATLPTMDRCRIASARVLEVVDAQHLIAEQRSLTIENGRFSLTDPEPRTLVYDAQLLPGVSSGDHVATHWGTAVLMLSEDRRERLERYDAQVLSAIPEAKPDQNRC